MALATDMAGKMWDDIRAFLKTQKDAGVISTDKYWEMTDLINDYGFAMKVTGLRGENIERTEDIFESLMGDSKRKKYI